MALGLVMVTLVAVGAVRALDAPYAKGVDVCEILEVGPIIARLGAVAPRMQPSPAGDGCRFRIADDQDREFGAGRLTVAHLDNAASARIYWQLQDSDEQAFAEVPGLGHASRTLTRETSFSTMTSCDAFLDVLDSNVIVRGQVGFAAGWSGNGCEKLDGLQESLIESTRATMARLA